MDLAQDGPEPVDSFPVALDAASSGVYQKEKVANDLSKWLTSVSYTHLRAHET